MGFLPEAMRNYLLRLGWSHGDDEIITTERGDRAGSTSTPSAGSPARFDMAKLDQPECPLPARRPTTNACSTSPCRASRR